MTLKCFLCFAVILLLVPGIAPAAGDESMEEVAFQVNVRSLESVTVPDDVRERLIEITKRLVISYLSADYQKSGKIMAETTVLAETGDGYDCQSSITFLYRETFTAVLARMEFHYIPEQTRGVAVERF